MKIIIIIILYFIQIRHTDDSPSTGTRLVYIGTATTNLQKGKISFQIEAYLQMQILKIFKHFRETLLVILATRECLLTLTMCGATCQ